MTLRRGFGIRPGENVIVVEDVITTGGSTRETIKTLEEAGASVIGAAAIIDRSAGHAELGIPLVALAKLEVPSVAASDCELCASGDIAIKPGSRKNSDE
jgi:orotate phosphoribosyltransferase